MAAAKPGLPPNRCPVFKLHIETGRHPMSMKRWLQGELDKYHHQVDFFLKWWWITTISPCISTRKYWSMHNDPAILSGFAGFYSMSLEDHWMFWLPFTCWEIGMHWISKNDWTIVSFHSFYQALCDYDLIKAKQQTYVLVRFCDRSLSSQHQHTEQLRVKAEVSSSFLPLLFRNNISVTNMVEESALCFIQWVFQGIQVASSTSNSFCGIKDSLAILFCNE